MDVHSRNKFCYQISNFLDPTATSEIKSLLFVNSYCHSLLLSIGVLRIQVESNQKDPTPKNYFKGMDLLPEDNIGYGTQEYWEGRYYKEREGLEYDWFKKYADLSIYLNKFIKKEDRIVMLGCGNSSTLCTFLQSEFLSC
jgi:hypothetical protein